MIGKVVVHDGRQYLVQAQLGRGGFGAVWKATESTVRMLSNKGSHRQEPVPNGHQIAIKTLLPDSLATISDAIAKDVKSRFRRESVKSQGFEHPNLVKTLSTNQGSDPHFTMELCEQGDLNTYLATCSELDSLTILRGICEGLAYLHEKGVIHRDLKPQNILFQDNVPKIADFGLAKWSEQLLSPDSYSMTSTRDVMGTLAYMAPEQRMSAKHVDERTDLFSIGLIFFLLVTRERLSTDDLLVQYSTNAALGNERGVDAQSYATRVERSFKYPGAGTLFEELTAIEPHERCYSAEDVVESISRFTEFSVIAEKDERRHGSRRWLNFMRHWCPNCAIGPLYVEDKGDYVASRCASCFELMNGVADDRA